MSAPSWSPEVLKRARAEGRFLVKTYLQGKHAGAASHGCSFDCSPAEAQALNRLIAKIAARTYSLQGFLHDLLEEHSRGSGEAYVWACNYCRRVYPHGDLLFTVKADRVCPGCGSRDLMPGECDG